MIEIDFIPVGEETNTGDAILWRFTDATGMQRVVLIDGGFRDTSDDIASHVREYYGTSHIDLMVCTHPDDDHINGLFGVFEELTVSTLLVHRPREFGYNSDDVKADKVEELVTLAISHGTDVVSSAFAGTTFFSGTIMIAGPSQAYYNELLAEQSSSSTLLAHIQSVIRASAAAVKKALSPRSTDPGEGVLSDHGGTTPRNNSSIILDVQVDGARALFTGDAGVPALSAAADQLDAVFRSASKPDFFDVPHHGSRHNLNSDILDRLLGPIVGRTGENAAFVSVGAKADDFPRAEVANALTRRGYEVCATRGRNVMWHRNGSDRTGWGPATPLPWLDPED